MLGPRGVRQLLCRRADCPVMAMEFSELFTQSARQVLRLARSKGLISHFDYQGPNIELLLPDAGVRSSIHRILVGITDCLDAGFLMFRAEAEAPIDGESRMVIHAAGTGDVSPALPRVLSRLGLQPVAMRDGERLERPPEAAGICPAMGGRVHFVDAGLDGLVISVEMHVRAIQLPSDARQLVNAEGAAAWLVGQGVGRLDSVERRLQRLGWRIHSFDSLEQASAALQEEKLAAANRPLLFIVAEATGTELAAIEMIAKALPAVSTVLAVLAGSPTVQAREHTPVDVRILPLSPHELERFTARVDPRTTTTALRETSPTPFYAHDVRQVLVVDDSSTNRLIARAQLEALGYEVSVAVDGGLALQACLNAPPDMVLMDVDMPVMDGLEATQRIRAMQEQGALPPFPIVAATSADSASAKQDCLDSGMDGFLSKPMDLQTLADEVNRVLPTRPASRPDPGG